MFLSLRCPNLAPGTPLQQPDRACRVTVEETEKEPGTLLTSVPTSSARWGGFLSGRVLAVGPADWMNPTLAKSPLAKFMHCLLAVQRSRPVLQLVY